MKNHTDIVFCLALLLLMHLCIPRIAAADPILDSVYAEYPKQHYLVGIGEVVKSGNSFNDKRVAAVTARVEIARQIRVRMEEETLDIACEGTPGKMFDSSHECKNEFLMIIKQSVNEVLIGSKIVDYKENDNSLYAIAVMDRKNAVKDLDRQFENSLHNAKDSITKAKEGDKEAVKEVEKEYMKAVAYQKEKEIIEGVKSNSSSALEELEREIVKLRGKR